MKTLTLRRFKLYRLRVLAAAAVIAVSLLAIGRIAGADPLISQGFFTSGNPAPGSIVSLQKNSTDTIEPAQITSAANILGVVIDGGQPPVSLSSGTKHQVQVATNGLEPVLVADINGNIKTGDPITASPIAGVGMKATANSRIIGIAQDKFPNSTARKQTYKDKTGQHTVQLGQIPVLVNVSDYFKQPDKTIIPQAIQNVANAMAGKNVNTLPILLSIGVFIVAMIIVVSIIYSMIRSSIISVGRNPMSQAAVYRDVMQLSALVIVILMVAVAAIYMILRKL